MKLPNFSWMTLRWTPIMPSPAATARACGTPPRLAGEWSHLHREPIAGFRPRCPRSSSVLDHAAGNVIDLIAGVGESVLATDRAGVRMASRS